MNDEGLSSECWFEKNELFSSGHHCNVVASKQLHGIAFSKSKNAKSNVIQQIFLLLFHGN